MYPACLEDFVSIFIAVYLSIYLENNDDEEVGGRKVVEKLFLFYMSSLLFSSIFREF